MSNPKVLYIICASHPKSGGGHFYSLKSLIECVENDISFAVLNIGLAYPKIIRDLKNSTYIPIFKYNLFKYLTQLFSFFKKETPSIIHAFDQRSLFFARLLSIYYKVPVVYTKCGGSNGSKNIPYADVSIFFSKENLEHYKKNKTFESASYLIPNRTGRVQTDEKRVKQLIKKYNLQGKNILLRISRFNKYYDHTFKQTINLFNQLKLNSPNLVLVFIGKIQSNEYFDKLKNSNKNDKNILYITEDEFTNQASQILNASMIVVATGRGAMEASSLGKIVFCPIQNSSLPALLNKTTIDQLLEYNFSERAILSGQNKEDYSSIMYNLNTLSKESEDLFRQYFDLANVKDTYLSIYKNTIEYSSQLLNLTVQIFWFFKL